MVNVLLVSKRGCAHVRLVNCDCLYQIAMLASMVDGFVCLSMWTEDGERWDWTRLPSNVDGRKSVRPIYGIEDLEEEHEHAT